MTALDELVMRDLVAFYDTLLEAMQKAHPHSMSFASECFPGKKNRLGLEVLLDGKSIGQYTFHLQGLKITAIEAGTLDPEVHTLMLGIVRPYFILEEASLIRLLPDRELRVAPLSVWKQYLPDCMIKFLP